MEELLLQFYKIYEEMDKVSKKYSRDMFDIARECETTIKGMLLYMKDRQEDLDWVLKNHLLEDFFDTGCEGFSLQNAYPTYSTYYYVEQDLEFEDVDLEFENFLKKQYPKELSITCHADQENKGVAVLDCSHISLKKLCEDIKKNYHFNL